MCIVRSIPLFFFSSRRRHTRSLCDWSSDVCSSDLPDPGESIYVDALTTTGSQELEVTRYRDGKIELEHVGDESGYALSEPERSRAASSPGECRDRAFTNLDYRVSKSL